MAEYLSTAADVFSALHSMIREAEQYIVIISPYIILDRQQALMLRKAAEKGVRIIIVYRLDDLKTAQRLNEISSLPGISIYGCPELHAKIYATEGSAIISSKNLTTRQMDCSIEIGIIVNHWDAFYDELLDTAEEIIEISKPNALVDNSVQERKEPLGYCIRCRKRIKINIKTPFCKTCLKWAENQYKSTPENYCLYCGKKAEGIVWGLPMENECYHKYIENHSRF